MCGITGIYSFKSRNIIEFKKAVEKMNQSQFYRGPDDGGIFIDEKNGVALGHRRLSILDLSKAGHQPMKFGESWITFNGEIYNFLELKKELEIKSYKFKTKTDTEVILALYSEYGEKSFAMLRGMFAFGLWDGKNQKLFLVKDRYGIKPLYYYAGNGKLVFASTVKALKNSGIVPIKKNQEAFIGFLLFGSVPLPFTTVKNIFAVPSGHYLEINSNSSPKIIKYYDLLDAFLKKSNDNFETAKNKIRNLLEESIKLHLISDAPLGVFLSGGLDSSAIAAMSALNYQHKSDKISANQRLITLSIIFDEEEFSEQKYQRLVVDRIKSNHKEIKIIKEDFKNGFEEIFEAMDQPTIDGVNTYFVSRAAKQAGLKAVLSGLGSDEIFMGYHYFRIVKFVRLAQKLMPGFVFSLLSKKGKWGRLQWLKEKHPFYSYIALRGIFSPAKTAEILKINENEVWAAVKKLLDILPSEKELEKLSAPDLHSYFDLNFYMANQLLKDTDFMSMAHSVEIRVPFLDHVLVEYLSSLPVKVKLRGEINKLLLVESVKDLLPQEIFNRPKMGFTFPFQKWLKESSSIANYQLPITKVHWSRFWAKTVFNKFNK